MGNTRSMTRHRSHDDDDARWSDINNDVLYLVMMKLGVIDFVSFRGVCKSWRSLALCNMKKFMASRPPMSMQISNRACKELYCYLKDCEGRKFKTLLSESNGRRSYLGLSCGYLVFYVAKTDDLWLINPITRHQLYFPLGPYSVNTGYTKAIIVFSPSIRVGWVFVMIDRDFGKICYSIAGKGAWNRVPSNNYFLDIHAFKGKIYALSSDGCLYEMSLNPNHKLSILETGNFGEQSRMYGYEFVSFGENLYLSHRDYRYHIIYKLDSGEMKPVSPEEKKKIGEYCAIFLRDRRHGVPNKRESWDVDPWSKYKTYCRFHYTHDMWYFPHCCVDVDFIDESWT